MRRSRRLPNAVPQQQQMPFHTNAFSHWQETVKFLIKEMHTLQARAGAGGDTGSTGARDVAAQLKLRDDIERQGGQIEALGCALERGEGGAAASTRHEVEQLQLHTSAQLREQRAWCESLCEATLERACGGRESGHVDGSHLLDPANPASLGAVDDAVAMLGKR